MNEYFKFLETKRLQIESLGLKNLSLNKLFFPFQNHIVNKALEKAQYAIFADCGLGKSFMELDFGWQVSNYYNQPALLITPLAVGAQTIEEARKFGYDSVDKFGKNTAIQIINYENVHKVNPDNYVCVILDESSIIKNHEGAYRKLINNLFRKTKYKLAATATPAPNDPMELGNHSEFLNKMSRNEMLSMFFIHDGGATSKWRLKKHAIKSFYEYVRQWSTMLSKPSDIGYSDDGYKLPNLNFIEHPVSTKLKDGVLFNNTAISATEFNGEIRRTMNERLQRTVEIANAYNDNLVIWIKQDEEGKRLKKLLPNAIEVKGSDPIEYKEEMLLGFAKNQFRTLITKTKIASFGLNWQNCHNTIFTSPDFSYEKIYQAARRFYRFGQLHDVNAHIITTDTMQNVDNTFKRKQKEHETMLYYMTL